MTSPSKYSPQDLAGIFQNTPELPSSAISRALDVGGAALDGLIDQARRSDFRAAPARAQLLRLFEILSPDSVTAIIRAVGREVSLEEVFTVARTGTKALLAMVAESRDSPRAKQALAALFAAPAKAPAPAPRFEHHLWSAKAAATLEWAVHPTNKQPVLLFEMAGKAANGDSFDWTRKITIQMPLNEYLLLYGVLRGKLPGLQARRGSAADLKTLEIAAQERKLFVRMSGPHGRVYAMPIAPGDVGATLLFVGNGIVRSNPLLRTLQDLDTAMEAVVALATPAAHPEHA